MSKLACGWLAVTGGASAFWSLGCGGDGAKLEEMRGKNAQLEARNAELEKELLDCKQNALVHRLGAYKSEVESMPVKYGGPPSRPSDAGAGTKDRGPCKCQPDDPLCSCL